MANKLVVKAGELLTKRAQGQPGEGPSFEQQFGILVNAQITDKYPALGDCKVAFQLQQKNDQNTFAVGAAVYNIGGRFIYVPAVFRQGKIWTGVIMFVPGMDRFLPLSDAWLGYVKNMGLGEVGDQIPADDSNAKAVGSQEALAKDYTDPFVKTGSVNSQVNVLDTAIRMGKKASEALLDKLTDIDYLNDALKFYSPEQLDSFAKKASEAFEEYTPSIITVLDKRASQLSEEDTKELFADGFVIKKATVQKVDTSDKPKDVKVIKIKEPSHLFTTPKHACKCSMLKLDGDIEENVFVCPSWKVASHSCTNPFKGSEHYFDKGNFVPSNTFLENQDQGRVLAVVTANGWTSIPDTAVALATSIEEVDAISLGERIIGKDVLPADTMFITPNGEAFILPDEYHVTDAKNVFVSYNGNALVVALEDDIVSPIFSTKTVEFPKGTKSVQKTILIRGDKASQFVAQSRLDKVLDKFIKKYYNKIKVYSNGTDVQISGDKLSENVSSNIKQAALDLVKTFDMTGSDAKLLLKSMLNKSAASGKPESDYFYISKSASIVDENGDWQEANIGMTVHEEQPPVLQKTDLTAYANQDPEQVMRDATTAIDAGIKEVFDMQTLKLLIESADPIDEIMDAVPDLMNCLDKIGRLIFLYHAHIDDMQKQYGAVKMSALSKSLQNTLKDLAELTVFIKLRGINNDTNHNPDAGQLETGSFL